jgi:hypothetical protein
LREVCPLPRQDNDSFGANPSDWDWVGDEFTPPRSPHPPNPSHTIVARTEGYTYDTKVCALCLVQGSFSVAPCQTLLVRFASNKFLYRPPPDDVRVSGCANTPSWVLGDTTTTVFCSGTPPAVATQLHSTYVCVAGSPSGGDEEPLVHVRGDRAVGAAAAPLRDARG